MLRSRRRRTWTKNSECVTRCDKASKSSRYTLSIIERLFLWIFDIIVLCEELLLDKVVDAAQGMASEIAYTRLV